MCYLLQAADRALTQASEERAELKEQAQQLRAAEQDQRLRQREAAERDSELKAFEHNLAVSGSPWWHLHINASLNPAQSC